MSMFTINIFVLLSDKVRIFLVLLHRSVVKEVELNVFLEFTKFIFYGTKEHFTEYFQRHPIFNEAGHFTWITRTHLDFSLLFFEGNIEVQSPVAHVQSQWYSPLPQV